VSLVLLGGSAVILASGAIAARCLPRPPDPGPERGRQHSTAAAAAA